MAKRIKTSPGGAPDWVVIYGDMMSLLLVFFVMLVSFSQVKSQQYQAVINAVQNAFGMDTSKTAALASPKRTQTLIDRLKAWQQHEKTQPDPANTDPLGIKGSQARVTTVREGLRFAIGGRITFLPGSSDLTPQAKSQLRRIVETYKIRGTNNIIELRGHASAMELSHAGPYPDLWALSYARARSVLAFLTSKSVGLRADRFRLIANADNEPLVQRAYTSAAQQPNRRVEILVTEALVRDFTRPESHSD